MQESFRYLVDFKRDKCNFDSKRGWIRVVRTFENNIPGFPGGKWMIPGVKLKKGCQIPGVFYAGFPVGHCVVYNSNAMMG